MRQPVEDGIHHRRLPKPLVPMFDRQWAAHHRCSSALCVRQDFEFVTTLPLHQSERVVAGPVGVTARPCVGTAWVTVSSSHNALWLPKEFLMGVLDLPRGGPPPDHPRGPSRGPRASRLHVI